MSKIISIVGVRGGVGASTLAINLATALQKRASTLLVNLSHPKELSIMLGQNGNIKTIPETLAFAKKFNPQAMESLLKVPQRRIALVENVDGLSVSEAGDVIDELSATFKFIVIDCGESFSAPVIEGLKRSKKLALVLTPSLPVLSQASGLIGKFTRAFLPATGIIPVCSKWNNSSQVPKDCVAEKLGLQCSYYLQDVESQSYLQAVEALAEELDGLGKVSVPASVNWGAILGGGACSERTLPNKNVAEKAVLTPKLNDAEMGLKQELLEVLLDTMDMKEVREGKELYPKAQNTVLQILGNMPSAKTAEVDKQRLVKEVLDEALGLGPLEDLLADESVSEVMVNAKDQIYAERKGKLTLTNCSFSSTKQLLRVIERIVAPIGRRIDESSPMVDARLADGSRVNIIIPPLALRGPSITIRKFASSPLQIEDLIRFNTITEPMAKFLKGCVKGKLNVLVAGGTGSGKTTLLNVLSSFIPDTDRIVTIEDAAELQLHQAHVVRLESRPPNIEGKGAVTIRDLVKNSLRMRPDRIVVGECRGGEALDMLQAMNTGHDGSLTTVHANSPRDSISRLETLVMFAGVELPSRAIREQIASAIDIIVQLNRLSDGTRKVVQITEVSGMEGDKITLQDMFTFKQSGLGSDGKVVGEFVSTGFRPRFLEDFKAKGIEL